MTDFASDCAHLWQTVRGRLGREYLVGLGDAIFGTVEGRVFVRVGDLMFSIYRGELRYAHYIGGRSQHGIVTEDGRFQPRGAIPLARPEWN